MTKEELAQKIKDSNYTCDGINCNECIKINGFNYCLQCNKRLFVNMVLTNKSNQKTHHIQIKRFESLDDANQFLLNINENDFKDFVYSHGFYYIAIRI